MDIFFVYVTTSNKEEAQTIARTVVEERLAACANILGDIQSIYWWDGKLNEGDECALILKTTDAKKANLIDRIKTLHSYECPCIVCLPVVDGNPDFLQWVVDEVE